MPLVIGEAEVRRLVSLEDLTAALEHALISLSNGEQVQPLRTIIDLPAPGSFSCFMPVLTAGMLGAKVVNVCPQNRDQPTHHATVFLWNPATGELEAIVAARYLTEVRTAAVSALSVKALARRGSSTLAILGSGVQARGHIQVLPVLHDFSRVLAWSPNRHHLDKLVRESSGRAEPASSAEAAVRWADVVVLATSSPTPVFSSRWVRSGTHIISLGAVRPNQREMDPAILSRSRLFVDSCAAALVESGDIVQAMKEGLIAPDHLRGELGEVLSGRVLGRECAEEITIFKSLGLAVEDVTAAALIYWRAKARGIGTEILNPSV
ncbi:MAG: ornithine cyclodeaminase family protein [Bryobacteraceae bacterium]|nr:ornithine cyclodeaminase family protein [Bryobacteraceae bacterium]